MSTLIITARRHEPSEIEASAIKSFIPESTRKQLGILGMAVGIAAMGVFCMIGIPGLVPQEKCVLFLYANSEACDSGMLTECVASKLGGEVQIGLNGRRIAVASTADFSIGFVPRAGSNTLRFFGTISGPVRARLVRLGKPGSPNPTLYSRAISPEEMAAGLDAVFESGPAVSPDDAP